jgi:hypothetical protein
LPGIFLSDFSPLAHQSAVGFWHDRLQHGHAGTWVSRTCAAGSGLANRGRSRGV